MKGTITYEEGQFVYRELTKVKTISKEQFFKENVKITNTIKTPLLPKGCVMYERKGNEDIYYVSYPRGYYNLKWKPKRSEEKETIHKILMPTTVIKFVFKGKILQRHIIGWCNEDRIELKKRAWSNIKLPNIYSDRTVCIGNLNGGSNAKEVIDSFTKAYLSNTFNHDLARGKLTIPEMEKEQKKLKASGLNNDEILNIWTAENYDYDNKKFIEEAYYKKCGFNKYFKR